MYDADTVGEWAARVPELATSTVPGVNHYTVVMSDRGAAHLARTLAGVSLV